MATSPITSATGEIQKVEKTLTLKERRKWDAFVTILILFLVVVAAVLFDFISRAEPLIADTGF